MSSGYFKHDKQLAKRAGAKGGKAKVATKGFGSPEVRAKALATIQRKKQERLEQKRNEATLDFNKRAERIGEHYEDLQT